MYQVDCEEPVATGLPLLLPEVALPAHWTSSCGYESLHIWSLGPAPCACSIAVRLELNSVGVIDFPTQGLAASSVEGQGLGWAGPGGRLMCGPIKPGQQWQEDPLLGWVSPVGWAPSLGWTMLCVTIFLPVLLAEETSPGAGEAQACRGRYWRLARTAIGRALLR